ncbi:MAG TPA: SHOCT domain-containing protein [Trichocoleus sp.]
MPNRPLAAVLALLGTITPLAGLHKFYLGQPLWGAIYLLLGWWTPIPKVACAIEGLWYLSQSNEGFRARLKGERAAITVAEEVGAIATALRELDQLRQEGLISEYEFEQKRRALLDQVG